MAGPVRVFDTITGEELAVQIRSADVYPDTLTSDDQNTTISWGGYQTAASLIIDLGAERDLYGLAFSPVDAEQVQRAALFALTPPVVPAWWHDFTGAAPDDNAEPTKTLATVLHPYVPAVEHRAYSKTCPPAADTPPDTSAPVRVSPSQDGVGIIGGAPIHDPFDLPYQFMSTTCALCVVAVWTRFKRLGYNSSIQDVYVTATKYDPTKHVSGTPYDPITNQDLQRPPPDQSPNLPPWEFYGWTFQHLSFEVQTTWVNQYKQKRVTSVLTPKVSQSNFKPGPHGAYSGTEVLLAPQPSSQNGAYHWSLVGTGGRWRPCA